MNRHERRKAARGKPRGVVTLSKDQLAVPIAGTVHWGDAGEHLGVWGQDKPLALHLCEEDGTVRPLTPAETRLARRMGYERVLDHTAPPEPPEGL